MNNPIPTTIEAREKLFDEKYGNLGVFRSNELELLNFDARKLLSIKSFNHESYNELLRAMLQECESVKVRCDCMGQGCGCHGKNICLSTLQDKLKSYIK